MPSLQCPFCDRPNTSDAHYCNYCGQQLQLKVCPQCEVVNNHLAESCYQCGTAFSATTAPGTTEAALERLREILRSEAPAPSSADPVAAVDGMNHAGGGSDSRLSPNVAEDALRHARAPEREPAISRGFTTQRALRLPSGEEGAFTPDFKLAGLNEDVLAPDWRAGGRSAEMQDQDLSEGSQAEVVQPVRAVATSRWTNMPLERVVQLRSVVRISRVAVVGTIAVATLAGLAYYAYQGPTEQPPDATALRSTEPEAGRMADTSRESQTGEAHVARAPMGRISSPVAAIPLLGITPPTDVSTEADSSQRSQSNETANGTSSSPPGRRPASAAVADQAQQNVLGTDGAASPVNRSPGTGTRDAASTHVASVPKQRAATTPATATAPVPCSAGVAALGLCTPSAEQKEQ